MENFLTDLIGTDNFAKYGFNIMFALTIIIPVLLTFIIVFFMSKVRDFIPDSIENIISSDEHIMLIIDKQIPSIFSILFFPFISFITFISWNNFKIEDIVISLFIGAMWLILLYYFVNSFFIKFIITNKKILYRNLLKLNYQVISIAGIKSVSICNEPKYGDLVYIELKETSKKMRFRTIKKAKEVQGIIEKLIYNQEDLEKVQEERIKKEKTTPLQWVMAIALVILFIILKFGLNQTDFHKIARHQHYSKEPYFGLYMANLQHKIKGNWNPPAGKESSNVVLLFKIDRDGNVLKAKILKSSNNMAIDTSALQALKKSEPLAPLPNEFKGKDVDIQFTFDYNVLSHKRRF